MGLGLIPAPTSGDYTWKMLETPCTRLPLGTGHIGTVSIAYTKIPDFKRKADVESSMEGQYRFLLI